MNSNVCVNIITHSKNVYIPTAKLFENWISATIGDKKNMVELCLLIVDEPEAQQLNSKWRNKNYATNILSFPADVPAVVQPEILGDLVACAPIIEIEAKKQGKDLIAHWAHMTIHGTLHLLGYDHKFDEECKIMEDLEIAILHKLGYKNPYLI